MEVKAIGFLYNYYELGYVDDMDDDISYTSCKV